MKSVLNEKWKVKSEKCIKRKVKSEKWKIMGESILKDRTYIFALRIIEAYKQVLVDHKEFVLSKQLLKAGTSVGALVREAEYGQSKPS